MKRNLGMKRNILLVLFLGLSAWQLVQIVNLNQDLDRKVILLADYKNLIGLKNLLLDHEISIKVYSIIKSNDLFKNNTEKRNQIRLLKDWMGKTIVYPDKFVYIIYGEDTVRTIKEPQFQIISYVDSIGCMSCKLKLKQWKPFIEELNTYYNVSTLFVFQAEVSQETKYMLKRNNFNYPVVFDENDSFGKFDWQEEQKATFTLKNAGDNPLVIQDVTTFCGCTTVAYSKEPVRPGKETVIEVGYKAESPGYFNKTIMVYCNTEISPLTLKINGNTNETKKKI